MITMREMRTVSRTAVKLFSDQRRVNFVSNGMWALKFPSEEEYRKFLSEFQDYLLENVETTVTTLFFFLWVLVQIQFFLKKITKNRKFEFLMRKKGICLFAEKKKRKRKYMAMIIVLFVPCSTRPTHPTRPHNLDPSYPIPDGYAVFTVHCGLELSKPEGHGSSGRTGQNPPEPTHAQPYTPYLP